MATYPAGIYSYTNRTGTQTLAVGTHSAIHNAAAAEIIAIETELGTNPKGIYVDVGTRLDALAAAIGAQHTQNTDVGTSSATFYMDGASGPKIKVSGTTFSVRDNADALYVDFTCDDLTCATINGLTAAQLAALQVNTHTHVNYALIQSYTQLDADLADAVTKKHTQNTDTGTNVETFQLNNVNPLNSARLKVDDLTPTIVDIRNAADNAFAPIRALEFRGVFQANNADLNRPAIQYNEGTNTWQLANDGLSFVDIGAGISMAGSQGEIQFNNTVNLGADPTFYYNDVTNTLYCTNINISGTIIGAVGTNITGTTADSFEINTDGNGLTITCAALANDRTVAAEDVYQAATLYHAAATAGAGIGVVGQVVSNTDTGSAAVTAHNLAYVHTDIALNTADRHAVATVLDSASVDFTLVGQQITAAVLPAGVDHNSLNNYSANRHIDHTAVSISTSTGLTGGGDISATRTLSLSHLGIESLTDPAADRIMFWDDSASAVVWLTLGTGLSITDTTINATGTVTDLDSAYNGGNTIDCDTSPVTITVSDTDNNTALEVVQNDVTNDPDAMGVTNTGTGAGILVTASGNGPHLSFVGDPTVVTPIDGDLWYTGTSLNFYDGATTTDLLAGGGATLTRATFTNASLTAGVLTITHSAGLSAPYTVMVTIFDNNSQQIIPDSITGATNTVAVDLSSYVTAGGGSIAGTWGYGYIA